MRVPKNSLLMRDSFPHVRVRVLLVINALLYWGIFALNFAGIIEF
jgi:hypothetical protein